MHDKKLVSFDKECPFTNVPLYDMIDFLERKQIHGMTMESKLC